MNRKTTGDKKTFAIEYEFLADTHETEIALFVGGRNILEFKRNDAIYTTRWNIDDIAQWLRNFLNDFNDDPYPVNCKGDFAAEKDIYAREYDTEDDEKFEKYYNSLYEWNLKHRWHYLSNGAILSDVYFQVIGHNVEISWNNKDPEPGVEFTSVFGCYIIDKDIFYKTVDVFLKDYAFYLFPETD